MKWDILKIYSYKFFDDFILIYAFYAVMFADFSMTAAQIGILLGVWSVVAFLLEVPSGVFADKYSRKHILFFAQLVRGFGYLTWILFPTFWGFLVGFIFWGAKSAFASGTFEALLYDLLDKNKRKEEYTKILGRAKGFAYAGNLCAAGAAAYAIQFGYTFILLMSIVSLIISAFSIMLLPKAEKKQSTEESKYFQILGTGLKTIKSKPILVYLILFLVFIYGLGGALDEYWPLFAENVGTPQYGIALFIGLMSAAQIVASVFAHKLDRVANSVLYGLLIVMGVLLTVASYIFTLPILALLIMYSGISTALIITYEGKLQHQVPNEVRATIGSVNGFFVEIMALAVYVGFGFLADIIDYQQAFIVFGYVTIFVGVVYLVRRLIFGKIYSTN